MINLFILLIINSLVCLGLYKSWQFEYLPTITVVGKFCNKVDNNTKGVFWFYKFYVLDRIPYRLSKPLGNCLTCMASVFSVLPYFGYYANYLDGYTIFVLYPIYVFALAGLNSVLDKFANE